MGGFHRDAAEPVSIDPPDLVLSLIRPSEARRHRCGSRLL